MIVKCHCFKQIEPSLNIKMARNNNPYKKRAWTSAVTFLGSLIFSVVLVVCISQRSDREQSHSEYYGSEGIIIGLGLQTMWEEWRK